ncbi:ClpP/crotonase-like domain-containing protein [Cunninghamella echinulata]|nr:ClpP/crotonase-like domain-containing protein [Cunninghamella echinulata]
MLKSLKSSLPTLKQQFQYAKPTFFKNFATLPRYQEKSLRQESYLAEEKEDLILINEIDGSRHVYLNRPSKMNAINYSMFEKYYSYIKEWEESKDVKLIFLKGNNYGERRLVSAGGDVKSLVEYIKNKDPRLFDMVDFQFKVFHYAQTLKTPYISVLDGITMGAGAGLTINTPFRIATEHTVFAMPETAIGLFPDVGACFYFPRLDGELGTYLAMTGQTIKSHDVYYAGLASHFVPSSKLDELESLLIKLDTDDHEQINSVINEFAIQHMDDENKNQQHYTLCGEIRKTIDRCFKYDSAEEIVNALEKDGSSFAKKARDTILTRSPTSVKIILKNLRLGRDMGVADCLALEHQLWQKCLLGHDFTEGVISHLVLKKQPEWKPRTLPELDDKTFVKEYYDTPSKFSIKFFNDINYLTHPHQHFALPSEKEIRFAIQQHPDFELKDIIHHFNKQQKMKFGIQEKVSDVWNRYKNI